MFLPYTVSLWKDSPCRIVLTGLAYYSYHLDQFNAFYPGNDEYAAFIEWLREETAQLYLEQYPDRYTRPHELLTREQRADNLKLMEELKLRRAEREMRAEAAKKAAEHAKELSSLGPRKVFSNGNVEEREDGQASDQTTPTTDQQQPAVDQPGPDVTTDGQVSQPEVEATEEQLDHPDQACDKRLSSPDSNDYDVYPASQFRN